MRLNLYIGGQVADLFGDESIQVVRSLFVHNKIDAAIGEFSQSFTLPATPTNDTIFKHWYEVDVFGGFNPSFGVDAILEVDDLNEIKGKIELQGVQMRDWHPEYYKVQFYGVVKEIAAALQDKTLQDFDWETNIPFDFVDYDLQFNDGDSTYYYPLVDYVRGYTYSDTLPGVTNTDISNPNAPIQVTDLRPAYKLQWMTEKVVGFAGYTLEGDFIDDVEHRDLYCLPMDSEGPYAFIGEAQNELTNVNFSNTDMADSTPYQVNITTETFDPNNRWNPATDTYTAVGTGPRVFTFTATIGPSLTDDAAWTITPYINAVMQTPYTASFVFAVNPLPTFTFTYNILLFLKDGDELTFNVTLTGANPFDAPFSYTGKIRITKNNTFNYGISTPVNQLMPDVKAVDFLQGVISMFNLIIRQGSTPNAIRLDYFDDYIEAGDLMTIDDIVDISSIEASKVGLSRNYIMKHTKGEDLGSVTFSLASKRDFGSMEYTPNADFPGEDFKVETPFVVLPFAQMTTRQTQTPTGLEIPVFMTTDLKPIQNKLSLFYRTSGPFTITPYYVRKDDGTSQVYFFNYGLRPFSDRPTVDATRSIAFSLEAPPSGEKYITDSLFQRYWQKTVESFFGAYTRRLSVTGTMDALKWATLELNTTVYLKDTPFKIETISYDLVSGKFTATLITFRPDKIPRITSIAENTGVVSSDITLRASDAKRLNLYNGLDTPTVKMPVEVSNIGTSITSAYLEGAIDTSAT